MEENFETREERLARLNRERVKRFKSKHGIKHFDVELLEDDCDRISNKLKEDGITKKEFVLKSFERYEKEGGFGGTKNNC